MWAKGQPWRVAGGLQKLAEQIRAYAPRAVPPATPASAWGSIADDAHSASSDHFPHWYSTLGAEAVVCARDFPHSPALGLDGGVVTEALRISRDPRIGYLIFNRRITGPNHGWQWEHYDGSDPHDTHFHVSSVHTALADDTRAWVLPGQGDGDLDANQAKQLADVHYALTTGAYGPEQARWAVGMGKLDAILKALGVAQSDLDAIEAKASPIDVAALAAALAPLLGANVDAAAVLAALESPEGQAALAKAANTAEDS